jgi:polar amino acid transport system permease protein
MNTDVMLEAFPLLLDGAVLTIELVLISGCCGLFLAIPLALMRLTHNRVLRTISYAYIFFFRGTPLLVQLFLVYYGVAQFDIIRENSTIWPIMRDPYYCALITMSLHTAAYIAEILRGAIIGIPHGEIEAAYALGMNKRIATRRIILPRAFQIALPAYGNEIILMLKGSALVSTITLLDLTGMAKTVLAENYMPVETYMTAGIIYLAITGVIAIGIKFAEWFLHPHYRPRKDTPEDLSGSPAP